MGWIIENLYSMTSTWNSKLITAIGYLLLSPQNFSQGIWTAIESLSETIKSVAMALIVLFMVYGMIKNMADLEELKRPVQAFKFFIRFALTKLIVMYSIQIMTKIFDIVVIAIRSVVATGNATPDYLAKVPDEVIEAVEQTNFLEQIPLGAVTILGGLFVTIMAFIIILTVYGRFFRLYLYIVIAPLPLSTFASHETENIARSFIKSYIGVCLEGLVIIVCCMIFSLYIGTGPTFTLGAESAVSKVWSYLGELIFNMLILVGSVRVSDRIVREMMGI